MKRWNKGGLGSLLKSLRTALIRGIVNEGSLGEISTMMLLLESMDDLKAGLGWSNVYDFLENLALKNKKIKEDMRLMIPKESQQFQLLHWMVLQILAVGYMNVFFWDDVWLASLQRNQDGTALLIPLYRGDEEDIKIEAILVQDKNYLHARDAKDIGMKLSASSYFQHWDEEDETIPLFWVVLELGSSRRTNKKPSSIPMTNSVDLVEVRVTRDQEGDAVYIVTCSD